ncbi:hypothetical protein LOK49_LG14G00127 [Camellia lanceoleosa]|uniref:Uncharacterized protein n=1 Tax=Camellia lanceoleosa TaxID=1840588 RepID=A0ACC0FA59_9ERIC|nr:hypothetical protein LOK49_LG14G00127 [Camellia lanceoleosa]
MIVIVIYRHCNPRDQIVTTATPSSLDLGFLVVVVEIDELIEGRVRYGEEFDMVAALDGENDRIESQNQSSIAISSVSFLIWVLMHCPWPKKLGEF